MAPAWAEHTGCETDKWLSLRLFLKMHAIERQGRSPDYSFAAIDAIDKNRSVPLESKSVGEVWKSFADRLHNRSLNHANNPLCPENTDFERFVKKTKETCTVKKISAVQLADELDAPLIAWAQDQLQRNKVKEAHDRLCKINGIGNKIASFFLRDVASHSKIAPAHDRDLLQPVDVWIRFVTHKLCRTDELSDDQCAAWIVEKSAQPESANQGIWYFCAEVGHSSQYLVHHALQDSTFFKNLVKKHLDELRRCCSLETEEFIQDLF
jgi:hypothetical protein